VLLDEIVGLFIHVSAVGAAEIPALGANASLLVKSFVCIDFSRYFCDSYFIHLLIIAKLRPLCTLFYRITLLSSGCQSADTQVFKKTLRLFVWHYLSKYSINTIEALQMVAGIWLL
jgi:hypothetical protein